VAKARTCCPGRSGSTSRTSATSSGSRTCSSLSWATTAGTPPPHPAAHITEQIATHHHCVRVRWRVCRVSCSCRVVLLVVCRVVTHCRMRKHRTWPDSSYYTCGLGCGMDNQPRIPGGTHSHPPTARARARTQRTTLTAHAHTSHTRLWRRVQRVAGPRAPGLDRRMRTRRAVGQDPARHVPGHPR
jgi:hypothetical protein